MAALSPIAIIGFGEVGAILARDLRVAGVGRVAAYDILFDRPRSGPSQAAKAAGVQACASASEAARGAGLVVSAVTAAQALEAARSVVPGIAPGAWFLDLNSASPGTKRAAGQAIEAAGGRYVEAAVMAPYPPKGIRTPMLLGGPHARAFLEAAAFMDLDAKAFSETLGQASAAKMCRSVMIKGTEALLAECLLTARRHGVEKTVLASLSDMLPSPDWERLARYMISRSLVHGRRRAEEMREVAKTVKEARVEPWMSAAAAERQDWAAEQAERMPPEALEEQDLQALLDAILKAMMAEA